MQRQHIPLARTYILLQTAGQILQQTGLGSLVEASPAVYEDMLVVGTRGKKICGVKIK
jgi:hypothetical protein